VDQGGFSLLLNYLSFLVSQLKIERDLLLEQELRVLLNILYATLIFSSAEEIQNEVSQESSVFEESLLKMIKLSTEYSYIPVKKICMVLAKYLKIILNDPVKHIYIPGDPKNETPRFRLSATGIEGFYVRTR
jgi:hypothetical protein